jgi:hypothetical protein
MLAITSPMLAITSPMLAITSTMLAITGTHSHTGVHGNPDYGKPHPLPHSRCGEIVQNGRFQTPAALAG